MRERPSSDRDQVAPAARSLGSGQVGLALAVALAAWTLLSNPGAPAAVSMTGMILLGAAAWFLGHQVAGWQAAAPGVTVALMIAIVFLTTPGSLSSDAAAPPLGYANANAGLITAGVAGLVHAAAQVSGRARLLLLALAAASTTAAFPVESRAAAVSCLLLLAVGALLIRSAPVPWIAVSGGLLVVGLLVVTTLGITHGSRGGDGLAGATLGSTRAALWSDALEMLRNEPVRGVGPGRFAQHSDIARSDADLGWAHSEPLQMAAELGAVGLVLCLLLMAWMVLALGRGAGLLVALSLQPFIDYTLHFPLVVATSALVLGAVMQHPFAQSTPRSS